MHSVNSDSTIEVGPGENSDRIIKIGLSNNSHSIIQIGPSDNSHSRIEIVSSDNPRSTKEIDLIDNQEGTNVETPIIRDRKRVPSGQQISANLSNHENETIRNRCGDNA